MVNELGSLLKKGYKKRTTPSTFMLLQRSSAVKKFLNFKQSTVLPDSHRQALPSHKASVLHVD
jgi:hypothetical protein